MTRQPYTPTDDRAHRLDATGDVCLLSTVAVVVTGAAYVIANLYVPLPLWPLAVAAAVGVGLLTAAVTCWIRGRHATPEPRHAAPNLDEQADQIATVYAGSWR